MAKFKAENEKLELIRWITSLSDTDVIANLKDLKDAHEGKDWWDELTPAQRTALKDADRQIEEGNCHSGEEVEAYFEQKIAAWSQNK